MSAMIDIWTQDDYTEFKRQRERIADSYGWLDQDTIDRWAALIVNQQKGI